MADHGLGTLTQTSFLFITSGWYCVLLKDFPRTIRSSYSIRAVIVRECVYYSVIKLAAFIRHQKDSLGRKPVPKQKTRIDGVSS